MPSTSINFSLGALSLSLLLGAAACGGDDDDDGDGGDGVTCGPGTVLDGDQCVPEDVGEGEAPTVDSIEPASGLVGGGESFTITGTGFVSTGDTTVSFGDSVAAFEIVSDTEITGTTPRASAVAVTVTVSNPNGSAEADFQYSGIYGADGKGALAGNLYLVDPRDGFSLTIGAIESEQGPHAITGLAFDAEGTLWASDATSGLDTGPAPTPKLLTIDTATGAATIVGALVDEDSNHRSVADLTFVGTALLGWSRSTNSAVSIDTATGAVTPLAEGLGVASFGNGLVDTGESVIVFPTGSVDGPGIRGEYYSVNTETGALTLIASLSGKGGASVCSATMFRGTVWTLLCPHQDELSGSVLATVDPADGTMTNITSAPIGLDAIASNEQAAPALGRFVPAPAAGASTLLPSGDCAQAVRIAVEPGTARTVAASQLANQAGSASLPGRRGQVRGLPLGSAAGVRDVEVVSCGGSAIRLSQAELGEYALVENSRGLVKLVDTTTGRTILRGVIELRAR
ncbi:MAG TPA: IPT/TIG domain-containing protein [Kofleriaceae bacterium]|jgi:hypothetical protein